MRRNSAALPGPHAAEESIRSGARGELYLRRGKNRNADLAGLARRKGIAVHWLSQKELDALAGGAAHRGAVFVAFPERPQNRDESADPVPKTGGLVLILDGVTDPQNLGSILRSADQFGVGTVLVPGHGSARVSRAVAAASAGATAWISPMVVTNLVAAMEELKKAGYWIYGADLDGRAVDTVDLGGKVALVMGSEGKGMRRLVREHCDATIRIPASGHVDSLNVSVAAGILLYEIRRQQRAGARR